MTTTGQQRAEARLNAILLANARRYADAPADKVTRQQIRADHRPAGKRTVSNPNRAMYAVTVRRRGMPLNAPVHQGPGNLSPLGRSYKKPHGQPNRSVTDLAAFPDTGRAVPDHLELTFHVTKGLRCVRVPT